MVKTSNSSLARAQQTQLDPPTSLGVTTGEVPGYLHTWMQTRLENVGFMFALQTWTFADSWSIGCNNRWTRSVWTSVAWLVIACRKFQLLGGNLSY